MSAPAPLRATYRLQLSRAFTLADARAIVPYLARLGISHLYASPALRSRPGSTHGYDVVDPTRLDPELGSDADWDALVAELRAHGMGLVLDIVPNHMGVGEDNPFWDDLFANGRASRYADWFDVDWNDPRTGAHGRVLVPILGDPLPTVLARGEIELAIVDGRLRVRYADHSFPTDPSSVSDVLAPAVAALREEGEAAVADALAAVLAELRALPSRRTRSHARVEIRRRDAPLALRRLEALYQEQPGARAALDAAVRAFTAGADAPVRLRVFLDAQVYALVDWHRAAHEINYRRFFDITELVALRMEDPSVFGATHRRVIGWVERGDVDGLRIDHVDGLLDPRDYLLRLRAVVERVRGTDADALAPARFPIFVEKILAPGESLRSDWPVDGTTGYEFLNQLESLFVDPAGRDAIEARYRQVLGIRRPELGFAEVAYRGKALVLRSSLDADVRRLARLLSPLAARDPRTAGRSYAELRDAIVELIAALPVYRTYIDPARGLIHADDRTRVMQAVARAAERGDVEAAWLAFLSDVVLLVGLDAAPAADRERWIRFVQRLQQTSGPAAAKGVEDTALYRWTPLLSLGEVGGDPARPLANAALELHRANAERAMRWPRTLLATSTHDTKHSADVRARIDVLSECPDEWEEHVSRWRRELRNARRRVRGRLAPDAHTEYLFWQTLVGVWPLAAPGRPAPDAPALAALRERLEEYMRKAVREAKAHSSWTEPNEEFERALGGYLAAVFAAGPTLGDVDAFVRRIARAGLWNALARTLVHCTAPGTPDIYQGDELWNFALVDPDNRRAVDFAARERLLASLDAERWANAPPRALADALVEQVEDGRLELLLIRDALAARSRHRALFEQGDYAGVAAAGACAVHVFAFLRRHGDEAALTVVPRFTLALTKGTKEGEGESEGAGAPRGEGVWRDTHLVLPADLEHRAWVHAIGGGTSAGPLTVASVLGDFPVQLLVAS